MSSGYAAFERAIHAKPFRSCWTQKKMGMRGIFLLHIRTVWNHGLHAY